MAESTCPLYKWEEPGATYRHNICKATDTEKPGEVANNLCCSSYHESCPVYKEVMGQS